MLKPKSPRVLNDAEKTGSLIEDFVRKTRVIGRALEQLQQKFGLSETAARRFLSGTPHKS